MGVVRGHRLECPQGRMWESLLHMKSKFIKAPAAFPHTEFPTHRQLWLQQGNQRLCHSTSTSQQGICALMVFSPTLSHQNLLLDLSSEPVKRTETVPFIFKRDPIWGDKILPECLPVEKRAMFGEKTLDLKHTYQVQAKMEGEED